MIRQLTTQEVQTISGAAFSAGNNNFSIEMWQRFQADAKREATLVGVLSGGLLGLSAVSLGAPLLTTALAATIVGGAVYQYQYENYEFWPWNF
jgi:hypothetical protein